jgi:colanic acid biosynthesis glycosyl transferase WcaI
MSRTIFINRFYHPDEPATAQLLADLAEGLAQAGREVAVIASRPAVAARRETRRGVSIFRVRTTRWGRRHVLGRIVDFVTFYAGTLWWLGRELRAGDTVVALTDPPLIGAVAWLAVRLRRASLVHWVQDIYPEIAADLTGHRWLLALRAPRNFAWRQARVCVVPGTDMAATLALGGGSPDRTIVSPNWAPAGLLPPPPVAVAALREAWGLTDKFVLGYSGNLGRVHDLDPLLDLAGALGDEPGFVLLFIGAGAQRAALETAARERGLDNVRFQPPQARAQLAVSLAVADVHFVTLRPGAERCVFPSKLYGIAAVGRPVAVIAARDCELARQVVDRDLGAAFTRDDIADLAAWIRLLAANAPQCARLGAAARNFAEGGFARALDQWQNLLNRRLSAAA